LWADFVGETNLFECRVEQDGASRAGVAIIDVVWRFRGSKAKKNWLPIAEAVVSVRPEKIKLYRIS
jgi:ABC-type Fe3+/spermidine/putrescine transport system ATPase subunit